LEHFYRPELSHQFKRTGFVKLENVIPEANLEMLSHYYWFLMRNQRLNPFPTSLGKYSDLLSESFLLQYQKLFEKILGLQLYPNFSFMRLYYHKSKLDKHCDRKGCEFAVSISIDYDADEIWPLFLKDSNGNQHSLSLDRGDMVLYKGCELEHWRDVFPGKNSLQLFLFYVNANGAMKHHKFDKRKRLGDPMVPEETN